MTVHLHHPTAWPSECMDVSGKASALLFGMLLEQQAVVKQKDHKLPLCPHYSSSVTHGSEAYHRTITPLLKFSWLRKQLLGFPGCFAKAGVPCLQITNWNICKCILYNVSLYVKAAQSEWLSVGWAFYGIVQAGHRMTFQLALGYLRVVVRHLLLQLWWYKIMSYMCDILYIHI